MLRTDANYMFGLPFARFMPLNPDFTNPTKTSGETEIRIVGGIGPFDFSDELTPAAIPLTIKFDNHDPETVNIDLTGVADITAVTVAELVDAITVAGPTDIGVSQEAGTGRILFQYNGTEDEPTYIQIYNTVAEIALLGQGLGIRFIQVDTLESLGEVPVMKDSETISVMDARGKETSLVTDSYRKGSTITGVDTAFDQMLRQLIEGGHIDPVTGKYEAPTSEDEQIYFLVEIFWPIYQEGENQEADVEGWYLTNYRKCKGVRGEITHDRTWGKTTYTINVTPYRNILGVLYADLAETPLTIEQYDAYDVYNV